jgi:uncharacterized protein
MIIEFTLRNYLSFKDEVTLSFVAATSKKKENSVVFPIENGKYSVLPFVSIFGANASGKTNILHGLSDFISFIKNSHNLDIDKKIPAYKPFKLDRKTQKAPVFFSIEFLMNNERYLYSVEFTESEVILESLVFYPEGRKASLFIRERNQLVKYGVYYKGEKKSVEKYVLKNNLFISRVANLLQDENLTTNIYRYFRDYYQFHFRIDSGEIPVYQTTQQLATSDLIFKEQVLSLLNAADFNIKDIKIEDDKSVEKNIQFPPDIPDNIKNQILKDFSKKPFLSHAVYDNQIVVDYAFFDLNNDESTGTIKVYDLSGIIINTLLSGGVLIIDEMNSGLHPYICQYITDLFLNKEINKKHSQLIISTHDTFILDNSNIERDQIWFTSKDEEGRSLLYCLEEFDKNVVRKNVNFGQWYLDGRFRGVPNINSKQLELWNNAKEKK